MADPGQGRARRAPAKGAGAKKSTGTKKGATRATVRTAPVARKKAAAVTPSRPALRIVRAARRDLAATPRPPLGTASRSC